MSPDDKVNDMTKQVQNDEDVYVTMYGRVLKRSEKLRSCGVTGGCTIQVTSRMRGGGRHKDKMSKAGKKRNRDESGQQDQHVGSASDKSPEMLQSEKDGVIQMLEGMRNTGCDASKRNFMKSQGWTTNEGAGMCNQLGG